ncbi:MAG: TonB-dependent receptor [Pseudomonadota bacterium]
MATYSMLKRSLIAGAAIGGLCQGTAASAQSAGSPEASEGNTETSVIVVTARKREEALQDVPIAITNFSEQAIRDSSSRNIADFLQDTPGLSISDNGGGLSTITLRGVATDLGGNAVGYYLDEVPFTGVTVPINPDVRSFDLNRVEVLRGPQGTLFGEGSQGGTIRILTNDPNTSRIEARGETFYGFTDGGEDSYGVRLMANLPIVEDVFAIRGVFMQEEEGGFIDIANPGTMVPGFPQFDTPADIEDDINDQELTSWRVKARLTPTDNLDIIGTYWSYDNNIDSVARGNDDLIASARTLGGVEYDQVTARVSYELPFGSFFYAFGDIDATIANNAEVPGVGPFDAIIGLDVQTHEARFSGEIAQGLNVTLGYFRREATRLDIISAPDILLLSTTTVETDADALFGEVEYAFTDRLRFAAGLRYFDETLNSVEAGTGFGGGPLPSIPIDEDSSDFSPRFILSFDATDDVLLYASAARGFRGAQPQAGAVLPLLALLPDPPPQILSPDSIWTFEAGAKVSAWDGRATIEAAVYASDWDSRTVRLAIPGTGLNALTPSDGLDIFGFDLSGSLQPIDGLTLLAGISYVDATNKSDVPGTAIVEGDIAEEVSDFTANASATYRAPIANSLEGFGRIGFNYATERDNPAFPGLIGPGDDIFQLDARFGLEGEFWGVYVFGDNLTNEDGAISSRALGAGGDFESLRLRPRTIGVELSLTY